ncbi:MAG: DegT/DnrJ/EryC1/StrS family aminotransferase [Chloroflexi bacterium]|nr:DegT/DnrJ/EryC1/StrS family aminotransferase [Chloroflexota bacterium]
MTRIGEKERAYVLEVLDTQFRSSGSSIMTKQLEEKFAQAFGVKYAISFVNGTATMHAALAAAGVKAGDEVIVPPLTMASTSFAVLHANALPVFADVDPGTWNIDPASIEARITPRTKAIIPVALYGLIPDMDAIMAIADRHHLFVLEDDAECFLGKYKGRMVGSIGHAASFSFQSSKHMTSGEGGMITTNDETLANETRRFNSLGYATVGAAAGKGKITKDTIQDPGYERHVSVGWNYRMPELCAAVALAQLEHLQELVDMRIYVAHLYAQALSGCDWLVPQAVPEGYEHTYWTYVLRLNNHGSFSWYDFRNKYKELGGDGIYAAWQLTYLEPVFRNGSFKPFIAPWHQEQLQAYGPGLCPTAESLQPMLLQFKTNYLTSERAKRAADVLAQTIDYFGR